jgi:NADH-ubiquinone oxidoreductase chain 6
MLYTLFLILLIILLSFLVVFSRNTIVSMLCLIWCFILTGICFLLLGAEFLSFVLIIVYGSAISILFLFIIMLLNLRLVDIYYYNSYYIPLCIIITLFLIIISNLFIYNGNINSFLFYNNLILDNNHSFLWLNFYNIFKFNSNLFNFGIVLYNNYYSFVIISSIILLIAMLGSILLVLNDKNIPVKLDYSDTKKKCLIKNYSIKK